MQNAMIDFEYMDCKEFRHDLVCASIGYDDKPTENFWLYRDPKAYDKLKQKLLSMRDDYNFLVFNATAEGRAFISLGLHPGKFKWIDIQAEYRMLLNHLNVFMYGKQLIEGKEKVTRHVSLFERNNMTKEQLDAIQKDLPKDNLVGCTYKMLGQRRDSEHKDKMRDLAMSQPQSYTKQEQKDLMEYCADDVHDLGAIWEKIQEAYNTYLPKGTVTMDQVYWRGECVARSALIEAYGYPVNYTQIVNVVQNSIKVLEEIKADINEQFPDLKIFHKPKKGAETFSMSTKRLQEWIAASPYASAWRKTKTGAYSWGLDAWTDHFDFKHDYPRNNFPAQMVRFFKTKQSFAGFLPPKGGADKKKGNLITHYVGRYNAKNEREYRARVYLKPYGSKTSRYQPKSTGYIPLKAAWLRSIIQPAPGRAIVGIDYKSQEVLIGALLSRDQNMIDAYASGDVYLHFAKLAGAVPMDGTREQYNDTRDLFKATTLGIGFGMGAKKLAIKLTMDTGKEHTPTEAQVLMGQYKRAFPVYSSWRDSVEATYLHHKFYPLADGWILFGDNDNMNSVKNFPVQGTGAAILRKAIQLAQDDGLQVIMPLHDALYIEADSDKILDHADRLAKCMRDAFRFWFDDDVKEKANLIGFDVKAWGPDMPEDTLHTPEKLEVHSSKLNIDGRARKEYERFHQFLEN